MLDYETELRLMLELIEDTNPDLMMLVMKRKKGISRKNHQNQQKSQQIRKIWKEWNYFLFKFHRPLMRWNLNKKFREVFADEKYY